MTIGKTEFNITGENQGTDSIDVNSSSFNVFTDFDTSSLSATITLQVRYKEGSSFGAWFDAQTFNVFGGTSKVVVSEVEADVQYRLFCKTGDYTSGSGLVRISY